ncbi:serine carboxypeptidase S28 [Colletotrichum zoysiae]|uniref:Serine carboxypeptidase S28 n=1 Tax=Colletotrichum zoysiae TaxID=1216348 RepID=A0AAD9LVA2_9PEZI|nr:serine carboxypeptidase S28 [Colletotrichum zoysiae]
MMKVSFALLGCLTAAAQAHFGFRPGAPPLRAEEDGLLLKRDVATFEQPIDHNAPDAGTFQQRYWWNSTYWKGPGSPVVVFTPGEAAGDDYTGYLTDRAISGAIAKEIGAAVLVVEHRYWGESLPNAVLDTKNLQQLTLSNAVADYVNFARNVKLPFDTNSSSNAPQAPWIFTGGSYGGYLAAAIDKMSPGTYYGYYSSSAPIQVMEDYWYFYAKIQEAMPKNCSTDLALIIDYVDKTIESGNKDEIYALKKQFGMQDVVHDDDFAVGLAQPLFAWQNVAPYAGYSPFFATCDAIETGNGTSTIPGAEGIGLTAALANFAEWWRANMINGTCSSYGYPDWKDPMSMGCWDTYNASSPSYTDQTANNQFGRTWTWLLCNEPLLGWQTAAPKDRPTIVSRLDTVEYHQQQCPLFFPKQGDFTYGAAQGKTADDVNSRTDGWLFTNSTRLIWTNGENDPFLAASVSSDIRPGGPLQSRPGAPVYLIPGVGHSNDLFTKNAEANADVQKAVSSAIAQFKTWNDEFYNGKAKQKRRAAGDV